MAGAKIILLLTILLASEAMPAYKLRYFNNALTNNSFKACTACMIFMDLYGWYNCMNNWTTLNHNLTNYKHNWTSSRIPPEIGFGHYLPLCRSLPGICHAVPRLPRVNKCKTKCKNTNKTKDPVGNQEDLTSVAASTCKPPRRPNYPCRNMHDAALLMCINYHQRM